jgi:dolichol-phosphate mannosyltransferase
MLTAPPQFCVVVPCHNEQESLPALVEELTPALEAATSGSWRLLMVDDGSTDATAKLIWELNAADPRIMGLRLSRNFGHQPAVATALRFASGQAIGIIDADLQDPPAVLVELFKHVRDGGWDVCSGQRDQREDVPAWLRFGYFGFYRLMAAVAEHPFTLDAGDFCVFNRRVHLALLGLPEVMQVQRGLRSWVGFRQMALKYKRPPRRRGASKYGIKRLVRLAVDNVINFTTLPLRLATLLGFAMTVLIGVAVVCFLINRFVPSFAPFGYRIGDNAGTTTLVLYFSVLMAALFICLGILGEYLVVVIREVKRRPTALVAETTPGVSLHPGAVVADQPAGAA